MKRIYKYTLANVDEQTLTLPAGAQILCVQAQHGDPQLWAMVDPSIPCTVKRRLRIIGTGHDINDARDLMYIGTYQLHGGELVFHVFEKLPQVEKGA